jgi:hypothetical protein
MPKLLNKFNLPEVLVNAIKNDPYDPGQCDISTTRLISPPQIVALAQRYMEEIEEDVSEGIWRVVGQSIHTLFERVANKNLISEKRYFAEVEGWKVSGQVDIIDGKKLIDLKVTSVWTYIYGSRIPEWTAQNNVNRWLAHKNGVEIDHLENYLILRDWVKSKSGGNYPPIQFVTVPLELWPLEKAEGYVLERVRLHQAAQKATDEQLAGDFGCTDEERWWNQKQKRYIRCSEYCSVSIKCKQFKEK